MHEFGTPGYAALISPETRQPSSRAAILIHVWKVGTVSISISFYLFPQLLRYATPIKNSITISADSAGPNCFSVTHIYPSQSCGWGVPLYELKGQRTTHPRWAIQTQNKDFDHETKKGGPSQVKEDDYPEKGIRYYQALLNQKSLDGLPALLVAFKIPLTSFVRERLKPITQVSTLSKIKKAQKGEECKSGCEPVEGGDTTTSIKQNYLKIAEEGKLILLAFFLGLVVATYLPSTVKAIGSNLVKTKSLAFHFPSS